MKATDNIISSAEYTIEPNDADFNGASWGYWADKLVLTSEIIAQLNDGKIIVVQVNGGEYSIIITGEQS